MFWPFIMYRIFGSFDFILMHMNCMCQFQKIFMVLWTFAMLIISVVTYHIALSLYSPSTGIGCIRCDIPVLWDDVIQPNMYHAQIVLDIYRNWSVCTVLLWWRYCNNLWWWPETERELVLTEVHILESVCVL
jgi:hypothetical protein